MWRCLAAWVREVVGCGGGQLVLVAQVTRRIGIDVGRWRIGVCVCLTFQ